MNGSLTWTTSGLCSLYKWKGPGDKQVRSTPCLGGAKTQDGNRSSSVRGVQGDPLLLPLFLQTVFPKLLLTPRHQSLSTPARTHFSPRSNVPTPALDGPMRRGQVLPAGLPDYLASKIAEFIGAKSLVRLLIFCSVCLCSVCLCSLQLPTYCVLHVQYCHVPVYLAPPRPEWGA